MMSHYDDVTVMSNKTAERTDLDSYWSVPVICHDVVMRPDGI